MVPTTLPGSNRFIFFTTRVPARSWIPRRLSFSRRSFSMIMSVLLSRGWGLSPSSRRLALT